MHDGRRELYDCDSKKTPVIDGRGKDKGTGAARGS